MALQGNNYLTEEDLLYLTQSAEPVGDKEGLHTLDKILVVSLREKGLVSYLKMLSYCKNLKIAYCQGNLLSNKEIDLGMEIFRNFKSLQKLDLSENSLTYLPNKECFEELVNLKILFLHCNKISKWEDLESVSGLPKIIHLTLYSNPVSTIPGYRHYLVNCIPSLLALDYCVITDEERSEDASFGVRYRAMNKYMKIYIPEFIPNITAEKHMFNLEVDIYRLKRIFERNSPSIRIQSLFRGFKVRTTYKNYFKRKKKSIVRIQKFVRGWSLRRKMKQELYDIMRQEGLAHLTYTTKQIRERVAKAKILKAVRFHLKRIRERKMYQNHVMKIQKMWRARRIRTLVYRKYFQIEKYPKILILKEQRRLFFSLLQTTVEKMEQEFELKKYQEMLHESEEFDTLRYCYPSHPVLRSEIPITNFSMPAYYSKLVYTKRRETFDKGVSVFKKYGSFIRKSKNSDRVISILKPQLCAHQKWDLIRHSKKVEAEQERNMGSMFDDYKDLIEFIPNDVELIKNLLYQTWLFNKTVDPENEPLAIFMPAQCHRIASAIKIQSVFRGYLFRKRINAQKGPTFNDRIIERRAIIFIQRWWQWYKIKRRIEAIAKIRDYLRQICTSAIYIEENLYINIEKILENAQTRAKFPEQMINFDFTTDYEIHPRQRPFEFLNISDRFERQVLPEWAGLDFPISFYTEMEGTDYGSDVTALLHYIQDPLTLIDNKSCIKGKESTVRFLRCEFGTVEEAKRRALILALCTYKITSKTFVPFYTDEMMKKPLILMKLRELWTAFKTHNWKGVDEEAEKKNVKSGEELPEHSGLIVAAEDQTIISNQPYIKIRVKTQKGNIGELEEIVVVEKDVIMTSTKEEVDQLKAKLLESKQEETKELVKHEPRKKEPTDIHIAKSNAFGIAAVDHTKFTTRVNSRKLSKAFSPLRPETDRDRSEYTSSKQSGKNNSSLMKNFDSKYFKYTSSKERAQDMKQIRAQIEEQKRKDIVKMREINQLMKSLGKEEHENNIKLFQKYNEDEKQIIKALISKAKEENLNEKINKKLKIIKQSRRKEIRQSQAKFALNFTRQKNLIEKYEQAGEKSKRIRKEKLEKSSKIRTLKSYKTNKPTIQLSTQLFDASFGEEKTFTKDQSSLNYQATMDTYRTEVLSNSLRKAINSQEPLKHMSAKQSYNSHRFPQNGPNLSIRNSITHEIDDNMSSQRSFNSGAAEHLYPGARSLTRIKYGKQSIIENTIPSIRGMLELPSIRNKPSLGKNSNFRGNYSFM